MRKYLIIALLLSTTSLLADHVDPQTAHKVATTFLNNNGTKAAQLTDLSKSAGFQNLYIFTTEQGFVVMAADDCVQPILGYSLTGKFVAEGMPENLKWWLQGYDGQIQEAIDSHTKATSEIAKQWYNLTAGKGATAVSDVVVGPLIQTTWDQPYPYNMYCPNNAVTGCVATAMAQVMKYWNYPTRGIGSHDYRYGTYGTISADFGNTLYDWTNMPSSCSSSSTETQKTAVATLMYHCGVSVEMKYSPSESGSNIQRSSYGLKTYFNYSASYIEKKDYDNEEWITILQNELNNNRPMLYGGSGSKGGHAFVCDGYRSDNYFHFNWGWSGSSDGYFTLASLTPGSYSFSTNQNAAIGITPSTAGILPLVLSVNQIGKNVALAWTDSQGCSSYNIYRNNALIATTAETTFTDSQPAYGPNVYYVRGLANEVLTLPSNYGTITLDHPTPMASHLTANVNSDNLTLSWNASEWCFPAQADVTSFSYVDEERLNTDRWYAWSDGDFTLSWGHRYPAESLTPFVGKALHEVSFFTMIPGAFDIVVYQGTTDGHPKEEIVRNSITTARMGWSRVRFNTPVNIDDSNDLWVFVINTDTKVHTVYCIDISNNTDSRYFAGGDPASECSDGITESISWLICPYLTDGTYTYNLYDGNTKLNGNVPITGTSYNINDLTNGAHQYTVTTNYYGGESDASNMAGITLGTTELNELNLDTDDVMTVTSGSTLTVNGTLSNTNPDNLVIEDGGQLIHPGNNVQATLQKNIEAYSTEAGVNNGWYTIASPVDDLGVNIATTGDYDLYAYSEKDVLWLNQENQANNITQFNEGQGFLYANATQQSLAFAGNMKATNEQITVPLSYQSSNTALRGFNLVGNPFTRNLGAGDITMGDTPLSTYYVVEGGSELEARAINTYPIKPGQGFLVQATTTGQNLVFNPSGSKGETETPPAFISIEASDNDFTDRAYIQLGEGNILHKMTLGDNHLQIIIRHENADFAAININEEEHELPLYFKARKNGTHTLTISLDSKLSINSVEGFAVLNYLHLIDNITGADVDLLQTPNYTFEAKTDDYAARFKLVFNANNDENGNDHFAFISNGNLIVTGEGTLQVIDMLGHVILTREAHSVLCLPTSDFSPGVYVIRTVNGNETKTDKIIIK